jgi:hypothetical protein
MKLWFFAESFGERRTMTRLRKVATLVVAISFGVLAAACGPPRYRYHFATKGGAERFPLDLASPPSAPDAGQPDKNESDRTASSDSEAPR